MTEAKIASLFIKNKNPIIFDVGANDGNYTKEILNLFHESIIYAFEPDEERKIFNFDNEKVKAYSLAISSNRNASVLYKPDDHTHNSFHIRPHFNKETLKSVQCKCETIDLFIEDNNIEKIDYLKIDTEGNEIAVFQGAQKSLLEGKIIAGQFEYGGTWKEKGLKFIDAYEILNKFGYKIFDLNEKFSLFEVDHSFKDDWKFRNFYFVKN